MWQALVKHATVASPASLTVDWPPYHASVVIWRRQLWTSPACIFSGAANHACRGLPKVVPNSAQWKLRDLDLDEGLDVRPVESRQEQLVALEQYGLVALLPRHVPAGFLSCKGN